MLERLTRLARATVPCPGAVPGLLTRGCKFEEPWAGMVCPHGCKGTGRVYLFPDTVRPRCQHKAWTQPYSNDEYGQPMYPTGPRIEEKVDHEACQTGGTRAQCCGPFGCNGRGWTPATDGWEEAVVRIGTLEIEGGTMSSWSVRVVLRKNIIGTSGQWRGEMLFEYKPTLFLAIKRAVQKVPGVEF